MGQGDSKNSSSSSIERVSSFYDKSSFGKKSAKRASRQLTDKERKKIEQLREKEAAKKLENESKGKEKDKDKDKDKDSYRDRSASVSSTGRPHGRDRAATVLQAAVRGTIGRRRFTRLKEERDKRAAIQIQAVVRGWLERKRFKILKSRTAVAKELLATERDYLQFLSLIIQTYIRPLKALDENDHPLLTAEEQKIIFSQVEVIYSYNSQFLVSLEFNIGKRWSFIQTIGDVFLSFVEFFRAPYKQFIMKYDEMTQTLDLCCKRSGVDAFFQKCKKRKECGNRDLHTLISMPFQRIPRYILLLKEILKYTPSTHDDFMYITAALKKMEDLAASANEQIRHLELTNAVLEISKKFEPPIQHLVNPYRKFKREGELQCKKEKSRDKFFDSTVFLFNDCFVITVKVTGLTTPIYRPKIVVNLKNCVVLDCGDEEEEEPLEAPDSWVDSAVTGDFQLSPRNTMQFKPQPFEFRVHSLTESIIFRAPSTEIKESWTSSIIGEINQLTESRLGSHPLWRSKASYGISTIKKKSLRKHTLRQQQAQQALVEKAAEFAAEYATTVTTTHTQDGATEYAITSDSRPSSGVFRLSSEINSSLEIANSVDSMRSSGGIGSSYDSNNDNSNNNNSNNDNLNTNNSGDINNTDTVANPAGDSATNKIVDTTVENNQGSTSDYVRDIVIGLVDSLLQTIKSHATEISPLSGISPPVDDQSVSPDQAPSDPSIFNQVSDQTTTPDQSIDSNQTSTSNQASISTDQTTTSYQTTTSDPNHDTVSTGQVANENTSTSNQIPNDRPTSSDTTSSPDQATTSQTALTDTDTTSEKPTTYPSTTKEDPTRSYQLADNYNTQLVSPRSKPVTKSGSFANTKPWLYLDLGRVQDPTSPRSSSAGSSSSSSPATPSRVANRKVLGISDQPLSLSSRKATDSTSNCKISGGIPVSSFLSNLRAERVAYRLTRYETGSQSQGYDSDSMPRNSSYMSLSSNLVLPDLPMARSISCEAILYVTPHGPDKKGVGDNLQPEKSGSETEIVDQEVLDIYFTRFRSHSFSYIEELVGMIANFPTMDDTNSEDGQPSI